MDHFRQLASLSVMSLQELLSGFQGCSTNSSQAVFELFENTLLTLIQESSRTGDTVRWWAKCRPIPWGHASRMGSTTDTWSDDEAEAVEYLHSLFNRAVKYHDQSTDELSNYHQQREKNIDTALTKIGTGKGPLNGGLEALAKGPVALHSEFDEAPQPITLILDGQSGRTSTTGQLVYGLSLQLQSPGQPSMFVSLFRLG